MESLGKESTCMKRHRPITKFAGGQKQLFDIYKQSFKKRLGAFSDLDNVECHVVGHPGRGRSLCD